MKMDQYILYKNPEQLNTLHIVQYLHFVKGVTALPLFCVERNHPAWAQDLPCIYNVTTNERYVGLIECVAFFRLLLWEQGFPGEEHESLLKDATSWKLENPNARISNK